MSTRAAQMGMTPNLLHYNSGANLNARVPSSNRRSNDIHGHPAVDPAPFGYQFDGASNQPPSPGWLGPTQNHILQDEQRLQYNEFLDDFTLNATSLPTQSSFTTDQELMQIMNVEGVGMTYGHPSSYPVSTPTNQLAESSPFDQMYQFVGLPQRQSNQIAFTTPYDFSFNVPQQTVSRPGTAPFFAAEAHPSAIIGHRLTQTQSIPQQHSLGFGSDIAFEHNGYTAPAGHSEDVVTGQLQGVMDSLEANRSGPNSGSTTPATRRSSSKNIPQKPSLVPETGHKLSKVRKLSSPKKKTLERRARLTTEEKKERHTQSEKRRRETIGGSRKALYDLTHIVKSTQHEELVKVTEYFTSAQAGIDELEALVKAAETASRPYMPASANGKTSR